MIVEGDECKGVILADVTRYESHTTILTTGTYLKAEVLVGHSKTPSGPEKQKESLYLSSKLKDYGFRIQRLKTGTPPRVEINSIDFVFESFTLFVIKFSRFLIIMSKLMYCSFIFAVGSVNTFDDIHF